MAASIAGVDEKSMGFRGGHGRQFKFFARHGMERLAFVSFLSTLKIVLQAHNLHGSITV
jgi:hypothetical protein